MSNFTPAWFKKGFFNESLFCDDFLSTHQLLYVNGAFFTPEGRVTDTMNLRCEIFDMLRDHIGANIAKRVSNVVDVLKLAAQVEDFPPVTDRTCLEITLWQCSKLLCEFCPLCFRIYVNVMVHAIAQHKFIPKFLTESYGNNQSAFCIEAMIRFSYHTH